MKYSQKPLLLLFPTVTVLAGAAFLILQYWEHKKELTDVENMFDAHIDSLSAVIAEAARESSESTALIYETTEEHLEMIAHLLENYPRNNEERASIAAAHGLTLWVTTDSNLEFNGYWGDVQVPDRPKILSFMKDIEPYSIADGGFLASLDIACFKYGDPEIMIGIICIDAMRLVQMRRKIGIGPLFKNIIQKDVLYVALQDNSGVLAVSPVNAKISKWGDDPFLNTALNETSGNGISRLLQQGNNPIFEGLMPFDMADDTKVLLRVGIDGSLPFGLRKQIASRFTRSALPVTGISLITVFLTVLLWLGLRKADKMEKRLADEREEKKHWETIGQMSATVAHEVRNPLNTIGMIAQRLRVELKVSEVDYQEFDEMIGLLMSESERVGRVVTGFLDLGKPLNLELREVKIKQIVNEALLPMFMRSEHEEKLLEVICRTNKSAFIDKNRFQQVLVNLVDNALDAIDKNGEVRVEILADQVELCISVVDNGIGIKEEAVGEIFKPFVSYKKNGTGLGLPLVKRIVKAHGGTLDFFSVPTKGSSVTIRIPCSNKDTIKGAG